MRQPVTTFPLFTSYSHLLPSGASVQRRARLVKLFAILLVDSTNATTPLTAPITSMAYLCRTQRELRAIYGKRYQ